MPPGSKDETAATTSWSCPVAGASDINLRGIAVTDAEIDLAGASNITLTMDGGALSGSMAGAGSIEYYGSVATESVRVAGAARIERVR